MSKETERKNITGKPVDAKDGKTAKAEVFAGKTAENGKKDKSWERTESELIERVVKISRVSKVVKGGKNFSFSALVVTGDGKGQVGIGFGKSNEVVEAIKKGVGKAKKSFIKINLTGDTIPHEVIGRFKASKVLLKPAGPGTGVIAGGPVRALCDAAGIKNILTKSLGSRNALNVVRAAVNGFKDLRLKRLGE
ncbi:MAG: 30S ribosomal protein S5 [Candidatus Omnitrophota bacterium]